MIVPTRLFLAIAFAILTVVPCSFGGAQTRPTAETDDLRGVANSIIAHWDRADLVCLGEGHGDRNDADLRLAMIRHPEFARRVQVIVVEFGDVAQQSLLDRFVLEGERMSHDQLRAVWSKARGAEVWGSPMYEGFIRAVADLNRGLTREQRVRIVAGDDPAVQNRGRAIRDLVSREILDKGQKGLALFGARHCERRGFGFPGELSDRYPGKIVAIFGFYNVSEGRRALGLGSQPELVAVWGTARARMPVGQMFAIGRANDTATLGDVVDAVIYYGNRAPNSRDQ